MFAVVGPQDVASACRLVEERLDSEGLEDWARAYHVPPAFLS
ncbi:MAG: hypothetical protein ACYDD7_19300 [Acidimicrobiales bacterium]